jgi:hypothetical protein
LKITVSQIFLVGVVEFVGRRSRFFFAVFAPSRPLSNPISNRKSLLNSAEIVRGCHSSIRKQDMAAVLVFRTQ